VDFTPYIGSIVTVIIAILGFYGAITTRMTRMETKVDDMKDHIDAKVDDLKEQVEKHNRVVERTYGLERDLNTAFKRIDELKERDEKIEQRIEKLHE